MAKIKVTLAPMAAGEAGIEKVVEGVEPGLISQTNGWLTFSGVTSRRPVISFPPGAVRMWEVLEDEAAFVGERRSGIELVKG